MIIETWLSGNDVLLWQPSQEHAARVGRYEESMAKLEAKKEVRNTMLRRERELFHKTQALISKALSQSEMGSAVITEVQLDDVILGRPQRSGLGRVS